MIRLVLFLLALGLATPTAAITWSECRKADWYEVGLRDGANGEGVARLETYRKACAFVGVKPDAAVWEKGRQAGLTGYCVPANAYLAGRRGLDILALCPVIRRAKLAQAFEHGTKYRLIGLQMAKAKNQYYAARSDLHNAFDDTDGMSILDVNFLKNQIAELEAEHARLTAERQDYATWPPG